VFRKILAILALTLAAWTSAAAANEIRIDHPVVDGVPVDWCRAFGQGCGWQGAHAFCRDRGYERALRYEVFNPGRTYLMSGDSFCTGPTCTAFQSVTCRMAVGHASTMPPPPAPTPDAARPARVRFDHPRNDGVPADWCSGRGTDCGWGGANKFCAVRGFDRAVDFSTYAPGVTRVAGDTANCTGPRCKALRHVVCERQATVEPPPGPESAPPGYDH
jgi:hypothetical protein